MKLIYDGNNTAYRADCVTELYNKAGKRTSAIVGTMNSIKSDIDNLESLLGEKVEEVIVAWDYGKSKRRMELYPEYKGTRKHDTTEDDRLRYEEFIEQTNYLHNHLPKLGIKSVKFKGWEGDDVIKALTDIVEGSLVVVSTDEDMLQLVNDHVTIYSPIKKIFINNMNFYDKVGVQLASFIPYKIIKGDTSDNIPGIDGIGEKTGKDLLNKYQTLQGVFAAKPDLMKSKRYSRIFEPEGLRRIQRNLQLICLDYVDYSEIKDDIVEMLNREYSVDDKAIMNMLRENQMVSILTSYKRWITTFQGLNG